MGRTARWCGLWAVMMACSGAADPAEVSDGEAPAPIAPGPEETAPAAAEPEPGAEPVVEALAGHDFIDEARLLYQIVACADDDLTVTGLSAASLAVIGAYCRRMERRTVRYRRKYVGEAARFFAELLPEGLPPVVVYPFGGGDLVSALIAYPDAAEITTMSLEHAGDPRRLRSLSAAALEESLEAMRDEVGGMLAVSNHTSKNLASGQQNELPGQLSAFLIALALNDLEPVSVRYFRLEDDGAIHYLSAAEIEALDDTRQARLKHDWVPPSFSPAFSNVELRFRARGGAGAPVRVHRHIAANLADRHLRKRPALLRHLEAKGSVVAMTKAASYLLWRRDFSLIRGYLLDHMEFMLSDSTGIPPSYADGAGFAQEPLGRFGGSFLEASDKHNDDFRALWSAHPYRKLTFRFGYVDTNKRAHLLVTRRL